MEEVAAASIVEEGVAGEVALVDTLGQVAVMFNLIQLLSGVVECHGFWSRGGVGGKSPACYLVGAANGAVWCQYGDMTGQAHVRAVNGVGAVLNLAYLAWFYGWSNWQGRRSVVKWASAEAFALAGFIGWLYSLDEGSQQFGIGSNAAGCVAAILSTSFTLSTAATVRTVVIEQSSKTLPLPIIASTAMATLVWCLYSVAREDQWMFWPNAAGFAFSFAQLVLYFHYRRDGESAGDGDKKKKKSLVHTAGLEMYVV